MTRNCPMTNNISRSLGIPEQGLYRLSSCIATKEGVASWLASLPQANLGETSRNLFEIVSELTRLRLPSQERFEILEVLYPSVRKICIGLAKHYLNQAIILPKKAQQVVDLAHTLQNELANSYLLVALDRDDYKKGLFKKRAGAVADVALYRATCLQAEVLLRSYQLYATVPERTWLKLHTQYQLACQLGVATNEMTDHVSQRGAAKSVHGCYVHALLLGCIKANQLRQEDLTIVHKLLPEWSNYTSLNQTAGSAKRPLFVVDAQHDCSPLFTNLVENEADLNNYMGIDSSQLVEHLRALMSQARQHRIIIEKSTVSTDLLKHLILAWGQCSKRSFMRMETDNALQICVGLSSAHHFAADQLSFDDMIELGRDALHTNKKSAAPAAPATPTSPDPWADAVDVDPLQKKANIAIETIDYQIRSFNTQSDQMPADQFHNFKVRVLNASPGGYSLAWPETTTAKIKAGDLVAIREQAVSHWSIGAIRWLHRPNKTDVQFGVELLSPAFVPTIARVIYKDREPSEFSRVLMLPEVSVTAQPKTLLAPHMRFIAGQKVQILQDGNIVTVKLQKQLTHTGAYAQFTYHVFDAANDANAMQTAHNADKFDSLWANL